MLTHDVVVAGVTVHQFKDKAIAEAVAKLLESGSLVGAPVDAVSYQVGRAPKPEPNAKPPVVKVRRSK